MPQWDAAQYLKFANERTQPAIDLIQRIELSNPRRIVDLGCGPGNSTEALRRRWPDARIIGLDRSPEMIAAAREAYPEGTWEVDDAAVWKADQPFDVVFANAMLHWLPDHARVCRHWMTQVAPGGALAVQQPAHYDSPLHREITELSKNEEWNDRMHAARTAITRESPAFYYDVLQPVASRVSVWETTYYHILPGPEAVLDWFRGTGLRPFLEALSSDEERARSKGNCLNGTQHLTRAGQAGKCCFRSGGCFLWRTDKGRIVLPQSKIPGPPQATFRGSMRLSSRASFPVARRTS